MSTDSVFGKREGCINIPRNDMRGSHTKDKVVKVTKKLVKMAYSFPVPTGKQQ